MKTYTVKKLLVASALLMLAFHPPLSGQELSLGKVEMQVSGADISKPYFKKGLLLLYNFQYESALKEFEMAELMDPDMVMACWGEAMCYFQGVWHMENYIKGRAALYKLGMTPEQRLEKARTEMEKGFIKSLEVLFAKTGSLNERHEKYFDYMKSFYESNPGNAGIAVFYAEALLERVPEHRGEHLGAAAQNVLEKVLKNYPDHPGALNLMIHASDTPGRAYKGLFAAEHYPEVVKNLPYALHLPAHVYLDLGRWPEMVRSNKQAWDLSEKILKKDKGKIEDWDYHTYWWLLYGYLQEGRFEKAADMVRSMHMYTRYSNSVRMQYFLAMMKAAYLVETGNWDDPVSGLDVITKDFNLKTKALCFFMEGMASLAKGDTERAAWKINQIIDQKSVDMTTGGRPHPDYFYCGGRPDTGILNKEQDLMATDVMRMELDAELALKKNDMEKAVDLAKRAADLEDKLFLPPGPPIIAKPAHELYGEILLEAGHAEEAIAQFDLSLRKAPNRTLSLLGKYRAYRKLGQKDKMASMKTMIKKNWSEADPVVLNRLD